MILRVMKIVVGERRPILWPLLEVPFHQYYAHLSIDTTIIVIMCLNEIRPDPSNLYRIIM